MTALLANDRFNLLEVGRAIFDESKSLVDNKLADFESRNLVRLVKDLNNDLDRRYKSLEQFHAKNSEEMRNSYEERLQAVQQSHDILLKRVEALDALCSQHMKHLVKMGGLQMESMRNSQGEVLNKMLEFLKTMPTPQVNNQINVPENQLTVKMEQQPTINHINVEKQDPTPISVTPQFSVNVPKEAIHVMMEQQPAPQVTVEGSQVLIPPEAIKMQVENLDALLKSQEASLEQIKSMVAAMLMPRTKDIEYSEYGAPVRITEKFLAVPSKDQ